MWFGQNRPREISPAQKKQFRLLAVWPKRWWLGMSLIVVCALAAILQVRAKHALVQFGYAISQAAGERERLLAEKRKLLVEVATLRSPSRLRKLAIETMGLVEPSSEQMVRVKKDEPKKVALQSDKARLAPVVKETH
jgi:cell division protein FtsL